MKITLTVRGTVCLNSKPPEKVKESFPLTTENDVANINIATSITGTFLLTHIHPTLPFLVTIQKAP